MQLQFKTAVSKTETNDRSFGDACVFSFEYLLLFIYKEKK